MLFQIMFNIQRSPSQARTKHDKCNKFISRRDALPTLCIISHSFTNRWTHCNQNISQIIKICLSRLIASVRIFSSPPLEICLHVILQLLPKISRVQGSIRSIFGESIPFQCCTTSVIFAVISFSSRIVDLIGRIAPKRWSVWQVTVCCRSFADGRSTVVQMKTLQSHWLLQSTTPMLLLSSSSLRPSW